jgi:alpha-L-fucosidase
VHNVGFIATDTAFSVLLFEDHDGNAEFDARADLLLGEARVEDPLPQDGEAQVTIDVDDVLLFKDNILYATFLEWPGDEARIYSLRRFEEELSIHWEEKEVERICMLGSEGDLDWYFTEDALVIKTPEKRPCEHAYVIKIIRSF